jgi:hypothetical protein
MALDVDDVVESISMPHFIALVLLDDHAHPILSSLCDTRIMADRINDEDAQELRDAFMEAVEQDLSCGLGDEFERFEDFLGATHFRDTLVGREVLSED